MTTNNDAWQNMSMPRAAHCCPTRVPGGPPPETHRADCGIAEIDRTIDQIQWLIHGHVPDQITNEFAQYRATLDRARRNVEHQLTRAVAENSGRAGAGCTRQSLEVGDLLDSAPGDWDWILPGRTHTGHRPGPQHDLDWLTREDRQDLLVGPPSGALLRAPLPHELSDHTTQSSAHLSFHLFAALRINPADQIDALAQGRDRNAGQLSQRGVDAFCVGVVVRFRNEESHPIIVPGGRGSPARVIAPFTHCFGFADVLAYLRGLERTASRQAQRRSTSWVQPGLPETRE